MEIIGSIAILASVIVVISSQASRFLDRRREEAEADYVLVVAKAVMRCLNASPVANRMVCANDWRLAPYSPTIYPVVSPFGATPTFSGISAGAYGTTVSLAYTAPGRASRIAGLIGTTLGASDRLANVSGNTLTVSIKALALTTRDNLLLHQNDVGDPELNRMRTDLNMNNNNITGINTLIATRLSATTASVAGASGTSVTATGSLSGNTATLSRGLSATTILAINNLSASSATTQFLDTPVLTLTPKDKRTPGTSCSKQEIGAVATHSDGSGKPVWCSDWGNTGDSTTSNMKWREPKVEVKILKPSAAITANQLIVPCPDKSWQVLGGGGTIHSGQEGVKMVDDGQFSFRQWHNGGTGSNIKWYGEWIDPKPETHLYYDANGSGPHRSYNANPQEGTYPVWIPRWRIDNDDGANATAKFRASIAQSERFIGQGTPPAWAFRGNTRSNHMSAFVICIRTGFGPVQADASTTTNFVACGNGQNLSVCSTNQAGVR